MFIGIIIGLIVGAGVMFFVYRHNAKSFAEKEAALKAQVEDIKAKAEAVKSAVKG